MSELGCCHRWSRRTLAGLSREATETLVEPLRPGVKARVDAELCEVPRCGARRVKAYLWGGQCLDPKWIMAHVVDVAPADWPTAVRAAATRAIKACLAQHDRESGPERLAVRPPST